MADDNRLKNIRKLLAQLDNRAAALAQERDDARLGYPARAQAVFALSALEFHLHELINHNIMPHLSKNERLQKLQEENKALKQELNKLQDQAADAPPPEERGDSDGEDKTADQQQIDVSLGEMNVDDVRNFVKKFDDVDALEKLLDAEMEGKNRKTAVEAIDQRIHELTADAED